MSYAKAKTVPKKITNGFNALAKCALSTCQRWQDRNDRDSGRSDQMVTKGNQFSDGETGKTWFAGMEKRPTGGPGFANFGAGWRSTMERKPPLEN